jgi:hypothetical protein
LLLSTPLTLCLVVLGRHVPDLEFLNILLGDEPVLTPAAHLYQRLLALDQHEAKSVIDHYLKGKSFAELCDSVVTPALVLAEQDRRRNHLDKTTRQLIIGGMRDLIRESCVGRNGWVVPQAGTEDALQRGANIVCLPIKGGADEISATILAQALQEAGYGAQCLPAGAADEVIAPAEETKTDLVYLTSLPPFGISRVRELYARLRAHSANGKIVVGLWGFGGDLTAMARRVGLRRGDKLMASLTQAVSETEESLPGQAEGQGNGHGLRTFVPDAAAGN